MRIGFVGHVLDRRTGSNAFFVELLRQLGQVTQFYADPDGGALGDDHIVRALANERFDVCIFWQAELIADRLLPLDLGRSFIVPTLDAVQARPPAFWMRFVKHHFLSFTRAHHEMLQSIGSTTSYFQYFPEVPEQPERSFELGSIEGFFWERHPGSGLSLPLVARQCDLLGIRTLHLHRAPDRVEDVHKDDPALYDGVDVRVSNGFASREAYRAHAERPLFFFAPRPIEGIGMAMLEAMASGQIVVAPDRPIASEYVGHLVSGLLYDPRRPFAADDLPRLQPRALRAMSDAARRKASNARRDWLKDIERLLSILADDGRRWSTSDRSAAFITRIRTAAHESAARAT